VDDELREEGAAFVGQSAMPVNKGVEIAELRY